LRPRDADGDSSPRAAAALDARAPMPLTLSRCGRCGDSSGGDGERKGGGDEDWNGGGDCDGDGDGEGDRVRVCCAAADVARKRSELARCCGRRRQQQSQLTARDVRDGHTTNKRIARTRDER
jgi:hypothetical protein